MIRKLLLIAAAVAMPVGIITATASTASAKSVEDMTGAPATASCTTSGGLITFKHPLGLAGGSYVFPTKNKGNEDIVTGVTLSCTSSAVPQGAFTGTLSGKIKTTNVADTPTEEYSCTSLSGVNPVPGATLAGTLKIKWAAPAGVKFSEKKSTVIVTSVAGGANEAGDGTFTIPGVPGTGSISGAFTGTDGGASSTSTTATAETEADFAPECLTAGGLSSIALGSGNSSLQ